MNFAAGTDVTDQPVFYLFIAATVILALGYVWGKRRNSGIRQRAIQALLDAIAPRDKRFVNIGGLTGYHATLTPPADHGFAKAEATILLLPRQAWLYLPISLLLRRHDRLYLSLTAAQAGPPLDAEGHLIDRGYSHTAEGRIINAPTLQMEAETWGGRAFLLYYGSASARTALRGLREQLPDPKTLRHVALVPEHRRIHIMLIPREDCVGGLIRDLYRWARRVMAPPGQR